MRRPQIACQRAVQSLQSPAPQHIWVPDDVLLLAVHRFFHGTCPHQKRHGSNVPGPLEARRRAAKRRMTASAGFYPQDSFPTSFSLGALFGYRSQPQNSWKYEPPSLPKDAQPRDAYSLSSPAWDSAQYGDLLPRGQANDLSSIDRDVPRSSTQQRTTQHLINTLGQDVNLEAVSPDSSHSRAIEHTLSSDDELETCLSSFKARVAVEGHVRSALLLKTSFRECLPPSPLAWKYYVAVLQHMLQLECNPAPVLQCLLENDGYLLRSVALLQSAEDCARFLGCLESIATAKHARIISLVRRIYGLMAHSAAEGERSTTEAYDAVLLRLIKYTGNSASSRRLNESSSVTRLLYALAAKLRKSAANNLLLSHLSQSGHDKKAIISTIYRVAEVPELFASAERALFYMPRQHLLAQIPAITLHFANQTRGKRNSAQSLKSRRMNVWLQLLQQVDTKANMDKDLLKAAMIPLAQGLFSYDAPATVPPEILIRALLLHQGLGYEVPSTNDKPRRFQALFADLLLSAQAEPKAYNNLLDVALPLIARHAGISLLLRCIRTMEEQKLPLSTEMNFEALVVEKLDDLHAPTDELSESQLQSRAYTLQACEKLVNVLDRMGHALPARMGEVAGLAGVRQFNHLLSRAIANNALPIAFRNVTTDLSLMERVAVVHQLAYHYSQDTTRTHREVWRSIYYLYNYLMSNSLPIGPLFTKAVVHSSITRPLTENRFVSARRLIWVYHLVARVEGDEVAARVENHFHTWRGDLIGRAKRIYVGVGGSKQGKAHVGTMKRLGLI
ncbi:hypothetical protein EKO04_000719 [Ascochyta lentis]|uniref:Uncharacterized protein n=1 Tax=Ascochyta lentis TaxID=205686 RepID=A0A8H7MML9_9PLEO|nr:hypothetical protein EKO04_000719 [Ascochyta lentis]